MDPNYRNDRVGPNTYMNDIELVQSRGFVIKDDENKIFKEIKEKRMRNMPGPGHYDIQSSFGFLPKFEKVAQE